MADRYSPAMTTTGKELRLARVAADLTITEVAARIGISRQSLWAIERMAVVDPNRAIQYRAALALGRNVTQTSEGAA